MIVHIIGTETNKNGTGYQVLGSYNGWGTPVPISNTEVKSTRADGSASRRCVRVGSCQDFDIKFFYYTYSDY